MAKQEQGFPRHDPLTKRWICEHCWNNEHHPAYDTSFCKCICRDPIERKTPTPVPARPMLPDVGGIKV